MGTFMASNKHIVLRSDAYITIQSDIATTLAFHIYERINATELTTISYRLEKIVGRSTTVVQDWADASMAVEYDLYVFDITATVAMTDKLQLIFKIVDVDGIETFKTVNDITVVE